ncbi:cytokinin dehydrogenase 3-like protein, partial [Tanacetum coccineum]
MERIGVSTDSEDTMNDDSPTGVASTVREGVTPYVVDMTVEMGKQNSLDDTIIPGSFPPLSTSVSTMAGNALGKSLYANITSKPSGKKVNVRTLFTPGGNGIDMVVLVDSIRAISEHFTNTAYAFFLGKKVAYPVEDVSTVPVWVKLHGVPVTACSEDGLSAIATKLGTPLMLDSYTSDMCMQSWGAGEKKTVKKPSQTSRGVPVGPKMSFKPHKEYNIEYRPVTKKSNASSSGNKKKGVEPTIDVSNSNPFDVLNSVDNDEE